MQWGFREIISTLRHKADVPVMTCQQKGVCFSFTSSLSYSLSNLIPLNTFVIYRGVMFVGGSGGAGAALAAHELWSHLCPLLYLAMAHQHTGTVGQDSRKHTRISSTAMDTEVSGWNVSHLRKPCHHSYLSKTSQMLACLHVPAMGPFPWGSSFTSCLVEKPCSNSASEEHLFKQSIIYENFPLKNRCPLAEGKQ